MSSKRSKGVNVNSNNNNNNTNNNPANNNSSNKKRENGGALRQNNSHNQWRINNVTLAHQLLQSQSNKQNNQSKATSTAASMNTNTNTNTNTDTAIKSSMNANANQYLPQRRTHQWQRQNSNKPNAKNTNSNELSAIHANANANTNTNNNINATSRKYYNNNSNNNYNSHSYNQHRYHHTFDPTKWIQDPLQHIQLTQQLQQTLISKGLFERTNGSNQRIQVWNHLQFLLRQWSTTTTTTTTTTTLSTQNLPPPFSSFSQIKLISFGSYRLGVHAPNADMDLLALCPPHLSCKKQDFFQSFVETLRGDERCSKIHPIAGAYTPVIKFYLDGVAIDLLFVKLVHTGHDGHDNGGINNGGNDDSINNLEATQEEKQEFQIKDSMLRGLDEPSSRSLAIDLLFVKLVHTGHDGHDNGGNGGNDDSINNLEATQEEKQEFQIKDSMLRGLDEPSSRSLNGVRVAQYLWNIIPKPNHETFRVVLKTVKEWANVHGLYSNVLGFLGGVNWAILVAWVCTRNPDASAPTLLKIFFHTFARWRWPKPVLLTPIVKNPPYGVTPLTIWDPATNPRDRAQILPIITPCYPSMNSAYNVAPPQLRRLREELHRGDRIMNQIGNGSAKWKDLLDPRENDFFKSHLHFLQVRIVAIGEEDHQAWFGLCESRLRILIAGLDSVEHGTHAYPFAKFFQRNSNSSEERSLARDEAEARNEGGKTGIGAGSEEVENEREHKNDNRVRLLEAGGSLEPEIVTYFFIALRFVTGVDSVEMVGCTTEFSYSVNSWEGRRKGMDLKIDHVLQNDLPDFVFEGSGSSCEESEVEEGKGKREDSSGVDDGDVDGYNNSGAGSDADACLNGMANPDDCLASPMKKAKIGRA